MTAVYTATATSPGKGRSGHTRCSDVLDHAAGGYQLAVELCGNVDVSLEVAVS